MTDQSSPTPTSTDWLRTAGREHASDITEVRKEILMLREIVEHINILKAGLYTRTSILQSSAILGNTMSLSASTKAQARPVASTTACRNGLLCPYFQTGHCKFSHKLQGTTQHDSVLIRAGSADIDAKKTTENASETDAACGVPEAMVATEKMAATARAEFERATDTNVADEPAAAPANCGSTQISPILAPQKRPSFAGASTLVARTRRTLMMPGKESTLQLQQTNDLDEGGDSDEDGYSGVDDDSDAANDSYTELGLDDFNEASNPLQTSQPPPVSETHDIPAIFLTDYEVLQLFAVSKSVSRGIKAYIGSLSLPTDETEDGALRMEHRRWRERRSTDRVYSLDYG